MKRCMSILLAFCMAWTLFPASTLAEMSDGDAVPIIAEADATSPDETSAESAALFDAGDAMTRGAWMREMVNLFGLTLKKDEYPDVYFPDIAESEYFDDIMVATKFGLADVEAGDNFEPDEPLTRDFAAHTLNFYLGIQNDHESYTYSDADSVVWRDDAQVAVDNGWFSLNGNAFAPRSTVTAEEISAMKASASDVMNRRRTDSKTSDYQFADYVKEIPSNASINSTLDLESGVTTLVISGYEGTLVPNDTIVFYSEGFAFVYGVDSVTNNDGVLTVITKTAPDNAIERFEFVGEMEPELSLYVPEGQETATLTAADGDPVTFEEVRLLDSGKGELYFERKFVKGEIGDKAVSGKLKVAVKHVKLDKHLIGNQQYIKVSGDLTVTSTMEVDFLNDEAADRLFLGGATLGNFGSFGVELSLKMKASIAYDYSGSFTIGLETTDGSTSLVKDWTAKSSCFTARGNVSAMIALAFRLDFGKVAQASASLSAGPKMEASFKKYSSGTPQQCINISGYLYAGFSINANLMNLHYEKSWDFYKENTSPIRFQDHIEDGVSVNACTRDGDSGETTGDYRTPKYTTPSNSRYYASSNANANGTGYGGYGSTEPVVIWQTSDNDDGTVTITGYSGNAAILNIPETIDGKIVTAIGNEAFQNNRNIRIVIMSNTITSIGDSAFSGCTNLSSVDLSSHLTQIGTYAFRSCSSLTSVDLPDTLVYLGGTSSKGSGGAFLNCSALSTVYIPASLERSYDYHYNMWSGDNDGFGNFNGCTSLDTVTFGEGITKIPNSLFYTCEGLTHIEIPNTVTEVGNLAFRRCLNLKNVTIPDSVSVINSKAFDHTAIESINIPDSVVSIGDSAFAGCENLRSVNLSTSVTEIGAQAFAHCTSLTEIELPEGLAYLGGSASRGSGGAFMGCSSLSHINIPASLEYSYDYHYSSWSGDNDGYGNFNGCTSLDTVTFGEGITKIPNSLFYTCEGLTHIEIPNTVTEIGKIAFRRCSNLKTVTIGEQCVSLGYQAFNHSGIETITIPDSVTSYGEKLFTNCSNLKSVRLSSNCLSIPVSTFYGCSSLESIEIPDGVTEIKNDTFNGCSSLKILTLPDTVTKIGNDAFKGCTALTDLTWMPNTVTSVGNNAFENCTGLTSVKLPDLVSGLGGNTFKGCANLTSFKGGTNLKTIGTNCFRDCAALTDVDFANGLTSIGNYAFQNCAALETIVLPDSVTSIGTYVFQKDAALKNVTLSSGLTQIPSYAFANCTSMTELEIPSGVTTIKDHAFYQDTKLKTFVIPASVGKIEDNAFSYPTTTTVYGVPGSYAETYAKWAAFLDIAQYRKTGTMGDAQELQWTYDPGGKTVTVTGAVNASDPVYVGSYDANGKMLSVKLITASNGAAQADDGANTVMLFWLDSNFMPKCGKATIRNA